jgi:hypothetical protein
MDPMSDLMDWKSEIDFFIPLRFHQNSQMKSKKKI